MAEHREVFLRIRVAVVHPVTPGFP